MINWLKKRVDTVDVDDLSDSLNQSVVDAVSRSMATIRFSMDGVIEDANENFLTTMGYSLDEIRGEHHRVFCDGEYSNSSKYKDFWKNLNRGEFTSGRFKRLSKDGGVVWLEASYNPIFDESSNSIGVVKFATDITMRVDEEQETANKMTALDRSTAIIEFNPDGSIVSANENFLSAAGYSLSEIEGKHHRIFCPIAYSESNEYREFWVGLNKGQFYSGQFERKNRNGDVLWLEATYNPIYDDLGKVIKIIKFASDITEQTLIHQQESENAMTAYRISDDTRGIAEEGTQVVQKAVDEINQIAEAVSTSSEYINELHTASSEISSIVNTIQGIADQTNLLALNAAIEAARAGDQGRGFAVVADEVRKLAASTTRSTAEIGEMVSRIQSNTQKASSSMEQSLETVQRGVGLVTKTGEVISKIESGATQVVDAINQISSALKSK